MDLIFKYGKAMAYATFKIQRRLTSRLTFNLPQLQYGLDPSKMFAMEILINDRKGL
jgi:hypothetical protein